MDYTFYNFMNNSKTSSNRAVIEGIQQGYLLCELNHGNITKAQYESLLGDAKNWVVDKAKKIGGAVKTGLAAAAMGAMLTACAGQHLDVDHQPTPEEVVEIEGPMLSQFMQHARTGNPITKEELQRAGNGITALIAAQVAINGNDHESQYPGLSTAGVDSLKTIYSAIKEGKIKTPEMANAVKQAQSNPTVSSEIASGAQGISRETQQAVNFLLGATKNLSGNMRILPQMDRWLDQQYQEAQKAKNKDNTQANAQQNTNQQAM